MSRPRRSCLLGLCFLAATAQAVANGEAQVPPAALEAIAAVHAAAAAKDFAALRALMDESEFTSSFGGEGGPHEAIALWRQEPALLGELASVTAQPCERVDDYVECPRDAETAYRAGFRLTAKGWRMQWFVAGD